MTITRQKLNKEASHVMDTGCLQSSKTISIQADRIHDAKVYMIVSHVIDYLNNLYNANCVKYVNGGVSI